MSTGVATPAGVVGPTGPAGSNGSSMVRQAILGGPTDSGGRPSYLPASAAGLSISTQNISASAPLVVSAANGFGASGPVDRIGTESSGLTWTSLSGMVQPSGTKFSRSGATITAYCVAHGRSVGDTITVYGVNPAGYNGTFQIASVATDTFTYTALADPGAYVSGGTILLCNWLWIDVAVNGTLTARKSTTSPVYQRGGTYSTANDQFTFNIGDMVAKVGNGSSAVQTYTVLAGKAWTNATAVVKAFDCKVYGTSASGNIRQNSGRGPLIVPPIASDFSWVNQGGSYLLTDSNSIFLQVPAAAGDNFRMQVTSIPAAPYSFVIGFKSDNIDTNYCGTGLVLRESGTGKIITFNRMNNTSPCFQIYKYTNPTTGSAQYFLANQQTGFAEIYMRVRDDGINRYFDLSVDGVFFWLLFSVSNTDFCTPDQIGFFANSNHVTNHPCITVFHVDKDIDITTVT